MTPETLRWSAIPPSFDGDRWLYAWTTFSLLVFVLLTLEWFWRNAWSFRERKAARRSGVNAVRVMVAFTLLEGYAGTYFFTSSRRNPSIGHFVP